MKISWIAMAEALAQDANGAYSLIRMSQNVLFAGSLPTQTKRALFVHLAGDSDGSRSLMNSATFTFSAVSPSGGTIGAQSGQIQAAEIPFPEFETEIDIPFEIVIPVTEFGDYRLSFRLALSDGSVDEATVLLHVLPNSRNPQLQGGKPEA
jgi:hypothetical protein